MTQVSIVHYGAAVPKSTTRAISVGYGKYAVIIPDEHVAGVRTGDCQNCHHPASAHDEEKRCLFGPASYEPFTWERKSHKCDDGTELQWWQMAGNVSGLTAFQDDTPTQVSYSMGGHPIIHKVDVHEPRTPKEKLRAFQQRLTRKARRW